MSLISRHAITLLLLSACSLQSLLAQGAKPKPPAPPPGDLEKMQQQQDLLQILRNAKPMPMPLSVPVVPGTPPGDIVGYDPRTRQQTVIPLPRSPRLPDAPLIQPPRPGSLPQGSTPPGASVTPEGKGPAFIVPRAATPPGPFLYPYTFPWNTVVKLVVRFTLNGTNYDYNCSAAAAASFHLISAGHCIYNHDIKNDGSNIAGWASWIWAWPAQTDVVNPANTADWPYGVANVTYMTTYNGWINNSDFNYDWSILTLDRRMGDHTGWMGRETNVNASSLNFDGYPTQTPYVPAGTLVQYPGYDNNNVVSYSTNRISLAAYIYGGHSGGPEWRYDGTNRYIQGTNSTSDRVGNAQGTRLDNNTYDLINNTVAADEVARPPVARPNLIEYVFDTVSKDLPSTSAQIGGNLPITYNVFNAGFSDSGGITVNFYASAYPAIDGSSRFLGSVSLGNLAAFTYLVSTANITVPTSTPAGTYYIGWVMNAANAEYNTDDNTVIIANKTVTFSCTPDAYEYDDSSAFASLLTPGFTQSHSICGPTDQDWARFTLTQPSSITLTTSGPSGDTRMWLYNSSLTQIDYNDDNGINLFSTITRSCNANELLPGTYYVKVDEYGNNDVIPSYSLALSTSVCAEAPTAPSVSPNSGSGSMQTFGATYMDLNGYADLNVVYILFNSSLNGANACFAAYNRVDNKIYLINNAGNALVPGSITPGAAGTLSNSQCTLNGTGSSVSVGGTSLILNLPITFTGAFNGLKNIYLLAYDLGGLNSGWQNRGSWTTGSNAAPTPKSVTPNSGVGNSQVFTFVASDANGYGDIALVYGLFNSSLNGANACFFAYNRPANLLYLINDAGTGTLAPDLRSGAALNGPTILAPITPGSGSVSNSQCTLNGVGSSVSGAGNDLSVTVSLTFQPAFPGLKTIYEFVVDSAGATGGWQSMGTWSRVNSAPQAVSVAPASGTGATQTFSFAFADPDGAADLAVVYALFNSAISGSNACFVAYNRPVNAVYLLNDAGTGLVAGSVTPGVAGSIANSQCTLSSGGAAVAGGNNLTLPLTVAFKPAFVGAKNVYLYALDASGANSGFQLLGTWNIP